MSMTDGQWKDLARDLSVAFFNAIEKEGKALIKDIGGYRPRYAKGTISRDEELIDRLQKWDKALAKRVAAALEDGERDEVADMVNDAWGEAEMSYADSKDSRYNTDYDESALNSRTASKLEALRVQFEAKLTAR